MTLPFSIFTFFKRLIYINMITFLNRMGHRVWAKGIISLMSSVWKKLLQFISCSDIINSSIFCKKKIYLMNPKVKQPQKKLFLLQHLCQTVQHRMKYLPKLLQLDITIRISHHQLTTRSKCQVRLCFHININ